MTKRNENNTSQQIRRPTATLEILMNESREIRAAHLKASLARAAQTATKVFRQLPALLTPRAV